MRLQKGLSWKQQDLFPKGVPENTVCITRYGGFGDMIMLSAVLPYFREHYDHVVVNTTPRGYGILRNDPNVDSFFMQEDDQVPNAELREFWEKLGSYFKCYVQLSESIEVNLLAIKGMEIYDVPHAERHAKMNKNYLEETARLAGVPPDFPLEPRFYPTLKETRRMEKYRKKLGKDRFVVLWSLAGSTINKAWPYLDDAVGALLREFPDMLIIMVGDPLCKMLETGWENTPRVIRRSGEWSIRDTLAFVPFADLIIGPETGVLNTAGHLKVPKIVILSHSSEENLTKHWRNTIALTPEGTPCYPCHKMHYGFSGCHRDQRTGVSLCAANIGPERVIDAASWAVRNKGDLNVYIPATVPRTSPRDRVVSAIRRDQSNRSVIKNR